MAIKNALSLGKVSPAGEYDVICARGLQAKNHIGNRRFKQKMLDSIPAYSAATSRLAKSAIVSEVLNWVRNNGGEFVKISDDTCQPVGDHLAREKIGQAFRDSLHSKYKSSTKAKRQRWKLEQIDKEVASGTSLSQQQELELIALNRSKSMQAAQHLAGTANLLSKSPVGLQTSAAFMTPNEIEAIVLSNHRIMEHTHQMVMDMKRRQMLAGGAITPRESLVTRMFTQANVDMLKSIKTDPRFSAL